MKFVCKVCGEEFEREGGFIGDWSQVQLACTSCRQKMKKCTITHILYEDGQRDLIGDCELCGSFPCKHGPWEVPT